MRTYACAEDEISRELFPRGSPRGLYWQITRCSLGNFSFLFIIYAYIFTCRRWNFIGTFPYGITTWSVLANHTMLFGEFPFPPHIFIIYAYICTCRRYYRHVVCIRKATMYKMKKSIDHVSDTFQGEISFSRCWKNTLEACKWLTFGLWFTCFFRSSFSCVPLASHVGSERGEAHRKMHSVAKISNVEIY